jgi:hypothetical protein
MWGLNLLLEYVQSNPDKTWKKLAQLAEFEETNAMYATNEDIAY